MEKYAKRLQDIINEQDFCFEPEEIRTVEKALGVLKSTRTLTSQPKPAWNTESSRTN